MRIAALISCLVTPLTERQQEAIRARGIEWVALNRRGGRVLLDVNGPRKELQWLRDKLVEHGLDPKLCGAWDATTGRRLKGTVDAVAWRAVAPDVATTDPVTGATTYSRPTAYRQAHTWLGWAQHSEQEED